MPVLASFIITLNMGNNKVRISLISRIMQLIKDFLLWGSTALNVCFHKRF